MNLNTTKVSFCLSEQEYKISSVDNTIFYSTDCLCVWLKKIGFSIFLICSVIAWGQSSIIPTPMVYQTSNDVYTRSLHDFTIDTTGMPPIVFHHLARYLQRIQNIDLICTTSKPAITVRKLKQVPMDAYSLKMSKDIVLEYSSEASCLYACFTLIQLLKRSTDEIQWKSAFISDAPKYEWRGLHLDVSRHFFSVDEVKRYLDVMAFYKFNTFHWHLTDDQGWRIEIKKYPLLTSVGAWRDSTKIGHYSDTAAGFDKVRYGGFYTQDQIRDVVNYAKGLSILVVPEIEMPGHARAALAAYPSFSCAGKTMGVPGSWGVFDDVFCTHESTRDFLKDILSEICELFPSPYVHIGGDETPKTRWLSCPKCKKVMRENGINSGEGLQSFFIREMDRFLTSKGKKLVGWDEILEGGLSENAVVMSWRGTEGAKEALSAAHDVILCPGSHCYFDHYQKNTGEEPLAIGGYTSLEKVYSFRTVLGGLGSLEKNARVLGAQGNLWTEYISDENKLFYMAYPRALALSECLWSRDTTQSFTSFQNTMEKWHYPILDKFQVSYCGSRMNEDLPTILNVPLPISTIKASVYICIPSDGEKMEFKTVKGITDGQHAKSSTLEGNWLKLEATETELVIRFSERMQWSELGFSVALGKDNGQFPISVVEVVESKNSRKWYPVVMEKRAEPNLFWLTKRGRKGKKVKEIKMKVNLESVIGIPSEQRSIYIDELIIR